MKKLLFAALLVLLLLSACGKPEASTNPATDATTTEAAETAVSALVGVWVNAGQYSEGRDFVETLTLNRDGTASVHLEYQGKDYATLTGTWTAEGNILRVDFTDPDTRDREYSFTLTETTLVLTGDGKDVEYQRQN